MKDIKRMSDEALSDPVVLYLCLKFDDFDPQQLRSQGLEESERRRIEREKEFNKRIEETEKQRKEMSEAVLDKILEEFEDENGHKFDEIIECYDSVSSKTYRTTLGDLLRQQLALTWAHCPDPRKNLNAFLNWAAMELRESFQVAYPVRNPHTTLRHNVNRITVILRRKK